MTHVADYKITVHDPKNDTDDEIAERVAFHNLLQEEVLPGEPPTPVDQAIASLRAIPERMRMWSFRARDEEGRLVGGASTSFDPDHDDNPDVFWVGLNVHPAHRRRGLGSRLLSELVALAGEQGRTRLIGGTNERVPAGAAFASAIGAEAKLADHMNHLPLEDVDRDMLERWVAEGPVRAADYELVSFDGAVPEEMLEAFVELVHVMNTAPRDDLQLEDFKMTPQQLREMEQRSAAAGLEPWTLVARHRPSGELAGFHDVNWNPAQPKVVWVGATGVNPEHRGHALGKWLKAAMTLRVLDERPDVTEIRTGNADSNDAMLAINRQMGYRPMIAHTAWEVPVAEVEKRLGEKGHARALYSDA